MLNWTDRWIRQEKLDPELPEGGGTSNQLTPPEESQDLPTQVLPDTHLNTGTSSPFAEGPLKGKTLVEIEAEYSILDSAVAEQGRRLTQQHEQLAQTSIQAPDDGGVESPAISSEEYYSDPAGVTERLIEKALGKVIAPFTASLEGDQTAAAWQEAIRDIPEIASRRNLIQAKFDSSGVTTPPNAFLIKHLYANVLGELVMAGNYDAPNQAQTLPQNTGERSAPPQHSASSQPIAQPLRPQVRQLTENEKTLARLRGWSDEEYLRLQSVEGENVLSYTRTEAE